MHALLKLVVHLGDLIQHHIIKKKKKSGSLRTRVDANHKLIST